MLHCLAADGPLFVALGPWSHGRQLPKCRRAHAVPLGPVVTENAIENSRVSNNREGEVRHGSEADVPPMK